MSTGRKRHTNDNKSVFRTLVLITQFGIYMLVPICICFFCGLWLDHKFDTSFLSIALFFIGAIAGARNVYILAKKNFGERDR